MRSLMLLHHLIWILYPLRSMPLVLKKFSPLFLVTNVLVDKEEIPRMNISNKVFNLNAGGVTYSRENFVAAVRHLGQGFDKDTKLPFYAENLSRIEALGGHGVMFPVWTKYVAKVFSNEFDLPPKPTGRMTLVTKKWSPLSKFVLEGGKEQVNLNGVQVTLKNISSFISMVNPRVSEEPIPATPIKPNFWANKPQSSGKSSKKLFSTLALVSGLLKYIRC